MFRSLALGLVVAVVGCAGPGGQVPTPTPAAPAGAPAAATTKPLLSQEQVAAAEPKLEAFLRRVLAQPAGGTRPARELELIRARPFAEGHTNETWHLVVDLGGEVDHAALKIFGSDAAAAANARVFRMAREHRWPIPTELVRGSTAPYSDRPSLLMEFMVGGSLRKHVEQLYGEAGALPAPEEVADLYGAVGEVLAYLHGKHRRSRRPDDLRSGPDMLAAIERCTSEGWCDPTARARLTKLAANIDAGDVSFCHGDVYETQIIMAEDGQVRAFIDLDEAGYADPAFDLGSLLGHILYVNPVARAASWKIPNPSRNETIASARQLLLAYRAGAGLDDAGWNAFLERTRAHAWLRMATLMVRYANNVHGKPMVDALRASARPLTEDLFVDLLGDL